MANSPSPHRLTWSDRLFSLVLNQPYVLLVLAPIFWGGNVTAGRLAVGHISPDTLVLGRWVGALLVLCAFALPHVRKDWTQIKKNWRLLTFYGAVGFAGFNMAMYTAAQFTTAVNASIEQAAIPVMVLIGNFLLFRVRPNLMQIIGLAVTVVGVIWVATGGSPQKMIELDVGLGDALVLVACLFYAIYSLMLRFRPPIGWISFIFVTAAGALAASIFFVAAGPGGISTMPEKIIEITPIGWMTLVYVMIFPSILAQLCYARGLSIVGANRASIFINLLPVTGTILSVLILGEQLQLFHLVAGAMVVVGITLAEYSALKGNRNVRP